MRTALGLGLCFAVSLVATSMVTAQTAVERIVVDIAAETRDLEFTTKDLLSQVEDLDGGMKSLAATETDLQVKESETEIRIELAADVLFDFDSADLRSEAEVALQNVAEIIRAHKGADVRVEGHTDAKGSSSYNQKLSKRRAELVRDWLLRAEGLSGIGFEITGFGESKPAAANQKPNGSDDPEGRQKNRRVEIVVEKQ